MKSEVAEDIRRIFNAPNRVMAESLLQDTIKKYEKSASRLANWMEANIPEGLTVFSFPEKHQRRLRTTNMLENLNKEIKRRTRVVTIFPNEASCLRLISAFLMEKSEEWQTGRKYFVFEGSS
jgi:transposase-like protein